MQTEFAKLTTAPDKKTALDIRNPSGKTAYIIYSGFLLPLEPDIPSGIHIQNIKGLDNIDGAKVNYYDLPNTHRQTPSSLNLSNRIIEIDFIILNSGTSHFINPYYERFMEVLTPMYDELNPSLSLQWSDISTELNWVNENPVQWNKLKDDIGIKYRLWFSFSTLTRYRVFQDDPNLGELYWVYAQAIDRKVTQLNKQAGYVHHINVSVRFECSDAYIRRGRTKTMLTETTGIKEPTLVKEPRSIYKIPFQNKIIEREDNIHFVTDYKFEYKTNGNVTSPIDLAFVLKRACVIDIWHETVAPSTQYGKAGIEHARLMLNRIKFAAGNNIIVYRSETKLLLHIIGTTGKSGAVQRDGNIINNFMSSSSQWIYSRPYAENNILKIRIVQVDYREKEANIPTIDKAVSALAFKHVDYIL